MTCVVALRAKLRCGAQRFGDPFGGALVVGGESHPHVTVVENGVVLAVGLVDLVERLRDQECAQTVASHERQCRLEEVQPTQRGKLIEHQQQRVTPLNAIAAVE